MDNTENNIDLEAITKNNLPKLTQSFVPILADLAWLSLSLVLAIPVLPVKA